VQGWISLNYAGCYTNCTVNCTAQRTRCTDSICQITGLCNVTQKPMPTIDACSTVMCNPATGQPIYTAINCDDSNACTVDTCDPVRGCQHAAYQCPGVSDRCQTTLCTNGTVNGTLTPICGTTTRTCDDNITCTLDSCDPAVGCVFRAQNASCSNDVCQVGVCDNRLGCAITPLSCGQAPNCTTAQCVPFSGCNIESIACNATGNTNSDGTTNCNIDYCNNQTNRCDIQFIACAGDAPVEVDIPLAVGLTTAAIVGIVIAIVVILALVGGAAAYRYRQYQNDEDAPVQNNPLYAGAGNKQDNPLFKPE
jgi:hypothetical protein